MKKTVIATLALLALTPGLSQATPLDLGGIQQAWAQCQYQQSGDNQETCLKQLNSEAAEASAAAPFNTDLLIWSAIVQSSWAGAKGGLGALSLVKAAKTKLEIAIKQDPKALDGSAYTSLGSLYYKVPGWPVGFGDDEKAEQLLKQALALNPDGIDPNFFYGDFLIDQGRKAEARPYLEHALKAPDRPGRALADQGRRAEAKGLLAKL
ncbi:tetratricopeptide repeat protein [Aeromonas rivuli]|uniref:tetratricopeptide repeat protein n=1 Tax=Aeromonas rivuli TaxID=648794 RepID=UPI001CCD0744|nr:tetratricopeptide repeat protein [Aeromonas rivuli]UBO73252.1 hypothetical protein KYK33_15625 [Aeromonas rivuli]